MAGTLATMNVGAWVCFIVMQRHTENEQEGSRNANKSGIPVSTRIRGRYSGDTIVCRVQRHFVCYFLSNNTRCARVSNDMPTAVDAPASDGRQRRLQVWQRVAVRHGGGVEPPVVDAESHAAVLLLNEEDWRSEGRVGRGDGSFSQQVVDGGVKYRRVGVLQCKRERVCE